MEQIINEPPEKLYSKKAIGLATFLGGPLAACLLMRRNFLNLGDEKSGLISIFSGTLVTMALIISVLMIPESIMEKLPTFIVPAIYTGVILLILESTQGKALKLQKEVADGFYSGWRAAGVGLIGAIILTGSAIGVVFLQPEDPTVIAYEEMFLEFRANEEKALVLYDLLEKEAYDEVPEFIVKTGIPAWQENLSLLKFFGYIQDMPEELTNDAKLLNKYCHLRIQSYDLIRKAILEDTNAYDSQIEKITIKTEEVLEGIK